MFFAQFLKTKDSSRALPLYRRCITDKCPHSQSRVEFCSCKQGTYVVELLYELEREDCAQLEEFLQVRRRFSKACLAREAARRPTHLEERPVEQLWPTNGIE
jgi:hypothetical protein